MRTIRRRAARRDTNERDIIEALTAAGATVQQLSIPNAPDLLVGYVDPETNAPTNALMEVKTARGKLEEGQRAWIETWNGQVYVVRTIEDALEAIGR